MANKYNDLLKPHYRIYRKLGLRSKLISNTKYWKKIDAIYNDFVVLDTYGIKYDKLSRNRVLIKNHKLSDKDFTVICRLGDSDISVFIQQFVDVEYANLIELINEVIGKSNVKNVIDCGSNIGLSCLLWSKFFPNCKIIGIEPDKENFELLKSNIALNCVPNILFLKKGFWYNNNHLTFNKDYGDHRSWSIALKELNDIKTEGVSGITLEDIISNYNIPVIDLLKVDIEGGEFFIIEDKPTLVQIKSKVKVIAIELHKDAGIDIDKFIATFKQINFSCTVSGEYHIFTNQSI